LGYVPEGQFGRRGKDWRGAVNLKELRELLFEGRKIVRSRDFVRGGIFVHFSIDIITVIEERGVWHKDSRMAVLSLVFTVFVEFNGGMERNSNFGRESGKLN